MSEFGNANEPGFAGSKKPGGLFTCESRFMPFDATPALSRPAESAARGSLVVGRFCAGAGAAASPALLGELETGKKLTVEVIDTNLLSVTTSLPLQQFAAARKGAPAQVFEQQIDE